MLNTVIGLFLFVYGLWAIYAAFSGKKFQFMANPAENFIWRKLMGDSTDRIGNFLLGMICALAGFTMFYDSLFS